MLEKIRKLSCVEANEEDNIYKIARLNQNK